MISQYEPNVKATIAFLRLLGVKVNNSTVNETLQSHPDWPSLLCISDSLHKWNVPNAAGRSDKGDIDQLPLPFVAHVHDNAGSLAIVKEVTADEVVYFSKDYNKYTREKKEDFVEKWDGVYLIAETNEHSGEINYNKEKQHSFFNSLIPLALFMLLIALSFYFLEGRLGDTSIINNTGVYFQYLILLVGVFVSSLLLWYEVDRNNPLLQKVCTGLAKTNCKAILTGKQAKLFDWLSWSEVGFIYFTGGVLELIFAAGSLANTMAMLGWLGILALPYTVFSIYYQWRMAKQWCVLCITAQVLLIAAAVNTIASRFLVAGFHFSFTQVISIITLYLLPALVWACARPYILKLQQAKNTKREYLRIKFNTEIFDTLLRKQAPVTIPVDGLGIDIGNINATNTLIKVCNPYCGPCAKAHQKIEKLLKTHDNLRVKIIFTASDDERYKMAKPVRHLMMIASTNNVQMIKKALDDWYLSEEKDYDVFARKYPINDGVAMQGFKLDAMKRWCRQMKIAATPTFYLNGYQLPDAYGIGDLEYFLLE